MVWCVYGVCVCMWCVMCVVCECVYMCMCGFCVCDVYVMCTCCVYVVCCVPATQAEATSLGRTRTNPHQQLESGLQPET